MQHPHMVQRAAIAAAAIFTLLRLEFFRRGQNEHPSYSTPPILRHQYEGASIQFAPNHALPSEVNATPIMHLSQPPPCLKSREPRITEVRTAKFVPMVREPTRLVDCEILKFCMLCAHHAVPIQSGTNEVSRDVQLISSPHMHHAEGFFVLATLRGLYRKSCGRQ